MDIPRVTKSVRRITVLQRDASGQVVPVTVFERRGERKKGTKGLGPVEKATRRLAKAYAEGADKYLSRHERSNEKKKDGWVRDMGANVFRASKSGMKALKLNRFGVD